MVNRQLLGKQSKRRGNGLENQTAKLLADWSGKTFRRTPASGAWSAAEQFGVNADVISTWPEWHFIVECKFYNSPWTLENLFTNTAKFPTWVAQAVREGQESKAPFLLVFRRNYIKSFVLMPFNAKATKLSQYMVANTSYTSEVTGGIETVRSITTPLETLMNEVKAEDFVKWYKDVDWEKQIKRAPKKKVNKTEVKDILSDIDKLGL